MAQSGCKLAKEKAAHPVRGERLDANGCYVRWHP